MKSLTQVVTGAAQPVKCLVAMLIGTVVLAGTVPIPGPDDPILTVFVPLEAQENEPIYIFGFNLGSAPVVEFSGSAVAPTAIYRPELGALVVRVPSGAISGPVTLTNNDTSSAFLVEGFVRLPGVYPSVCTITGTATSSTMMPLAGTTILVEDLDEDFFGVAQTAVGGTYSADLPASGSYNLRIVPPPGTNYLSTVVSASCPGVRDFQLDPGLRIEGTVRSAATLDPVQHAEVLIEGQGLGEAQDITDATGHFETYVPPGTYDIDIDGPVGGNLVSVVLQGIPVNGNIDLGNIDLVSGSLISGEARLHDGSTTGVIVDGEVLVFDSSNVLQGRGVTLADRRFFATAPATAGQRVTIVGELCPAHPSSCTAAVPLDIRFVDLLSDLALAEPLDLYTAASQTTLLPSIVEIGESLIVREGQPMAIEATNLFGTDVDVQFPDGFGGFIDGDDTEADSERAFLMTRVPTGAVSGDIALRVDGVTGPGFPLTVVPGVHPPEPFTLSGSVSRGTAPVAGALMLLFRVTCIDEVIDYTMTDAQGAYSLSHGGQGAGFFLGVVPPVGSGAGLSGSEPHLVGDQVRDFVLPDAHPVTGRIIDSGVGPVGATGSPIAGSYYDIEHLTVDVDEAGQADDSGMFGVELPDGDYTAKGEPPFLSRYLDGQNHPVTITGPDDIGDLPLASGFFIEGRVVTTMGSGVAGVEVEARQPGTFDKVARMQTRGSGGYRLAVAPGQYDVAFIAPDTLSVTLPGIFDLLVTTDTLVHPDVVAQPISIDIPGPVPNGELTPSEAMVVTGFDQLSQQVTIEWQSACAATDHALYFGQLGDFGVYTDALCSIGIDETETFVPPSGNLFWLVVGENDRREGSYGLTSAGVERSLDGSERCDVCQDLRATCE